MTQRVATCSLLLTGRRIYSAEFFGLIAEPGARANGYALLAGLAGTLQSRSPPRVTSPGTPEPPLRHALVGPLALTRRRDLTPPLPRPIRRPRNGPLLQLLPLLRSGHGPLLDPGPPGPDTGAEPGRLRGEPPYSDGPSRPRARWLSNGHSLRIRSSPPRSSETATRVQGRHQKSRRGIFIRILRAGDERRYRQVCSPRYAVQLGRHE